MLWQGRFRSFPTQEEQYLLACQRYIELNPVRAGMVEHPADYRWSSYRANAQGEADALIAPHALYLSPWGGTVVRSVRSVFCYAQVDTVTEQSPVT
jgi:hypothetical protein